MARPEELPIASPRARALRGRSPGAPAGSCTRQAGLPGRTAPFDQLAVDARTWSPDEPRPEGWRARRPPHPRRQPPETTPLGRCVQVATRPRAEVQRQRRPWKLSEDRLYGELSVWHPRLTTCAWSRWRGCRTCRCACRSSSRRRAGTPRLRRPRPRRPSGAAGAGRSTARSRRAGHRGRRSPHRPPRNSASRIGRWPKRPLIGSSGGAAPSWKRTKVMARTAMPSPNAPTKMPAGFMRGERGGVGRLDVAVEERSVAPQVDRGEEQQRPEARRRLTEGDVGVLEPARRRRATSPWCAAPVTSSSRPVTPKNPAQPSLSTRLLRIRSARKAANPRSPAPAVMATNSL